MKKRYILIPCLFLVAFSGGFLAGYKQHNPEPVIKEIIVTKNIDRIVYRNYSKVDCCEIARGYDTAHMNIKYSISDTRSDYTSVELVWNLYDRNGLQEIRVPVHESGNWKLYTGVAVGAVAVGGIAYLLK